MRYTIKKLFDEAVCEVTGKTGEAVLVESDDGLQDAILRFSELQKMIRFRAIQEGKQAAAEQSLSTSRAAG